MGRKDRKRDRSESPSSSSEAAEEEKRHKHKHKHKKKSKHKKRKHHSSSSDSDAEVAAAKAFLQQHLQQQQGTAAAPGPPEEPPSKRKKTKDSKKHSRKSAQSESESESDGGGDTGRLPAGVQPIEAAAYFEKSAEFTAWLLETKGVYFNELTSEEAHKLFEMDFVRAWNKGKLKLDYYKGLVKAPMKRTTHDWGLKKEGAGAPGEQGLMAYLKDDEERRTAAYAAGRQEAKASRQQWKREQREQLDELLPKPTAGTREAQVEKRMARREATRAREDSPELLRVVGGGDIMGGDDSFQAAKAREAQRQQRRTQQAAAKQEALAGKLSAAAEAEAAKMAQFRALVQASGGAISIPKRQG